MFFTKEQKAQQLSAVNVSRLNKLQLPDCFSLNETRCEISQPSCIRWSTFHIGICIFNKHKSYIISKY